MAMSSYQAESELNWYNPVTPPLFGSTEGRFLFTPQQLQTIENKIVPQTVKPTVVSTPSQESTSPDYFHFNFMGKEFNIKKNIVYIIGGIITMTFVYFVIIRGRL